METKAIPWSGPVAVTQVTTRPTNVRDVLARVPEPTRTVPPLALVLDAPAHESYEIRGDTSSRCVVPRTTSSRLIAMPVDAAFWVPTDRTSSRWPAAASPVTLNERVPGVAA